MTRGEKVLFSFIALVLGTFLFTVFVHYQFVYSLNIRFIKPEEYPLIGEYMPFYFYWGSVTGMAILALVILWIILRPTEVMSIKLSEDKGKLEIKKNAIVGLIQSQVSQTNLLNDSKVKVKMYKRKIKVSIFGNTGSNLDIVNQTDQLANNIESYINNFVGLDTSIKAKVVFKNTNQSNNHGEHLRRVL